MQLSAHPIAAAPAALPPVAAPANGSPTSGEDSPFAKLLSAQAQPQEAPKAEPETKDKPAPATHDDKPATSAARPAAAAARKPVAAARGGAVREAVQHDDAAKDATKDAATDGVAADAAASSEASKSPAAETAPTTMDPALAQWLASLNRPVLPANASAGATPIHGGAVGADGVALDVAAAKPQLQPAPLPNETEPRAAKGGEHKLPGFEPVEPERAAGAHAALVAALEERPATAQPAERSSGSDTSIAALAASGAAHAPVRAEPAAAPPAINLPTPVNSPEFKAALGMQVSLLARDGVQHAELHLNPAEMGPISVRIALDGSQAQVDFGADSAHTRHVIEAGLPELASALRDAGLTLSGGGVSQHARDHQPQGDGAARERGASAPRGIDAGDAGTAARRVNLRLPQGAVDLYA